MATKAAIAKMAQDAMNRISAAMDVLVARFGGERLDLASVRFRDPAYERAAQLDALAIWLDQFTATLAGIDLPGVQATSQHLISIRYVLDRALNALPKRDLEAISDELGLDFHGAIKQEFINVITEHLTGTPVVTLDEDLPENFVNKPDDPDLADYYGVDEDES